MSGCWCDPSWKKPSNFSKYTTSQLGTPPRGSDKCLLCWSWRHSDNYHSWYCISGNDSVVCKYEPNSDSLVHKQGFGITVGTQRKPYGSECGSWSKLGHISLQLQSHARAAALASFSHSSQGCWQELGHHNTTDTWWLRLLAGRRTSTTPKCTDAATILHLTTWEPHLAAGRCRGLSSPSHSSCFPEVFGSAHHNALVVCRMELTLKGSQGDRAAPWSNGSSTCPHQQAADKK